MPFSKPIYKEDIVHPHRPMVIRKHKRYIEPAIFIDKLAEKELSELIEFSTEKKEEVEVKAFEEEEQGSEPKTEDVKQHVLDNAKEYPLLA